MRREIWKPIPGYEGNYIINESGCIMRSSAQRGTHVGKIIQAHADEKGYMRIRLTNGYRAATLKVHRLLAMAFIDNPYGLPQINHKDTNKKNNHYCNLEWCTNLKNRQHAHLNGLDGRAWLGKKGKEHNRSIPIYGMNKKTGEKRTFYGSWEAARELNLLQGSISNVLSGRVKSTGGWTFSKI